MTEIREIKNYVKHRVPRAGKLRLGVKKKSERTGNEYPAEVPYFVLDADLEGRDAIVKLYGEQPTKILVMFLSDDPREILPFAYKAYTSGKSLICKGDGVKAERARIVKDEDGREVVERDAQGMPVADTRDCPCDLLKSKKCGAKGNLLFTIPAVGPRHYQIDTGSWHALQNVHNALREFGDLFKGSLRGKLFWLERRPQETHGSGRKETHYPLFLSLPSPEEYRSGLADVGDLLSAYRSVLDGAPALEAGHDPARLPVGSPLDEEDLVRPPHVVDVPSCPISDEPLDGWDRDEALRSIKELAGEPEVRRAADATGLKGRSMTTWTDDEIRELCRRTGGPLAMYGGE